ncbi:MAG: hypothetical protein AVDCRST_MAG73-3666 [uncultured Thermomicrobiales bacterium]|uniref:Uncharacterized protein n=1 Tax=uncultured Thermomicrobiales bacterium TaxID=1645740 RepID=A0A6J4UYU2_9BACT|nr:MAG: hypothetical protein AVDCRST_MAG73-3666 [uncultured Thermomicrobiales bacterium]
MIVGRGRLVAATLVVCQRLREGAAPGQPVVDRVRHQLRVAEGVANAQSQEPVLVAPGIADERPNRNVRHPRKHSSRWPLRARSPSAGTRSMAAMNAPSISPAPPAGRLTTTTAYRAARSHRQAPWRTASGAPGRR